jgi:hypothetical protein
MIIDKLIELEFDYNPSYQNDYIEDIYEKLRKNIFKFWRESKGCSSHYYEIINLIKNKTLILKNIMNISNTYQ